jgi:hypothetical protein
MTFFPRRQTPRHYDVFPKIGEALLQEDNIRSRRVITFELLKLGLDLAMREVLSSKVYYGCLWVDAAAVVRMLGEFLDIFIPTPSIGWPLM